MGLFRCFSRGDKGLYEKKDQYKKICRWKRGISISKCFNIHREYQTSNTYHKQMVVQFVWSIFTIAVIGLWTSDFSSFLQWWWPTWSKPITPNKPTSLISAHINKPKQINHVPGPEMNVLPSCLVPKQRFTYICMTAVQKIKIEVKKTVIKLFPTPPGERETYHICSGQLYDSSWAW